jgi:hypothetical protein
MADDLIEFGLRECATSIMPLGSIWDILGRDVYVVYTAKGRASKANWSKADYPLKFDVIQVAPTFCFLFMALTPTIIRAQDSNMVEAWFAIPVGSIGDHGTICNSGSVAEIRVGLVAPKNLKIASALTIMWKDEFHIIFLDFPNGFKNFRRATTIASTEFTILVVGVFAICVLHATLCANVPLSGIAKSSLLAIIMLPTPLA